MKRLMIIILLFASANVSADFMSGSDLKRVCNGESNPEKAYCVGYIIGVADHTGREGAYCLPSGVTPSQLMEVVMKDMELRPEANHLPADILAEGSIQLAFPCPKE
jgi:hypothetical protein